MPNEGLEVVLEETDNLPTNDPITWPQLLWGSSIGMGIVVFVCIVLTEILATIFDFVRSLWS